MGASADGTLKFDTQIDTDNFKKGTNTIKSQCNGLGSSLKGLGKLLAATFAVKKLVDFGKQAIELASDLQEVQNVVDTSFGNMSYKMEEFAKTCIDTYGMSKLTAKQMGSTFMSMGRGIGIEVGRASDMALELTGRAGDIASFYNKSAEESQTLLKSIYTGETESLKQIGVVMTQANLQQFAYTQGINKKIAAMTQAEQVQLRYSYVMQQTSLAEGDFAKTSDSWANQTRILSERWKEFLSIAGTGLIQVFTPVVKLLNTLMSYLISFANTLSSVFSNIFGGEAVKTTAKMSDGLSSVAASTEDASAGVTDMAESTEDANKKMNKSLSGIDQLNNLSEDTANNAKDVSNSVGGMGNALSGGGLNTTVSEPNTSKAEKAILGFINRIKDGFESFKTYISDNFAPIFDKFVTDLQPRLDTFKINMLSAFDTVKPSMEVFKTFFLESVTPAIQNGLILLGDVALGLFDDFNMVFGDIITLVDPMLEVFQDNFIPFFDTLNTTMYGILSELFESFQMVFGDIWNAVFPMIESFVTLGLPVIIDFCTRAIESIGVLFDEVKKIFDMLWTDAVKPVIDEISKIWQDLMQIISDFWEKWGKPIFDNFNIMVKKMGTTLRNVWTEWLKPVWDKFMECVDILWTKHLKPFVANFLDLCGEIINGAISIYNQFIDPIINWLIDLLAPAFKSTFGTILNVATTIIGKIIDVMDGIITTIKGIVKFITGVFTGDWKKAWSGVKDIFKGIWDSFINIAKSPINLIIGLINGMLNAFATGINTVIRAINKLSFDVPDWVPMIGGQKWGFNIKEVSAYNIPKLAHGTVVPANFGEFKAILGDNKREPEVVSPLSTIEQALMNVLTKTDGTNGPKEVNVNLYLDGKKMLTQLVKIDKENVKSGGTPVFAN